MTPEQELHEFLQDHPEMLDLQLKISLALAGLNTPEDRMYYLSVCLYDSFFELKEKLQELEEILHEH